MKQSVSPVVVGVIIAVVVVVIGLVGWKFMGSGPKSTTSPTDMQAKIKEHMGGDPQTGGNRGGAGSGGMRPTGSGGQ